ncbi:kinase-like protein [Auricularia subglabra TFB-10046 SS5]|nr:kinase-like protein [Auricularia subglabra TFB-10046 SS5]
MLRRELRAAQRIKHQYIVSYVGTADFDFHTILISPYMENGNLLQYLEMNPTIDRRPLLVQVATALAFLHKTPRLVHGDLKCENVLVSDDGTALLGDFGLSTFIERAETGSRTLTALRQRVSVQFAAPELLISNIPRSKTDRTDVYAFGMTILQVRTSTLSCPFRNHVD